MKIVYVLVSFAVLVSGRGAHSEPVDDLVKAMSPQIQIAKQGLAVAATLKEKALPLGIEISETQCLGIRSRIERNYPVSPFVFIHRQGSLWSAICGRNEYGSPNEGKFFFSEVNLTSQFLLPIKYMLTYKSTLASGEQFLTSYLLDQSYSIVEIQTENVSYHPRSGQFKTSTFEVSSVDAARNFYRSTVVTPDWNLWMRSRQYFSTANGEVSAVRVVRKRRSEYPEAEVDHLAVTHRVAGGWDAGYLIPTFAWSSPVFKLGTEYGVTVPGYSWLGLYSIDGKDVCSEGHSIRGANLTRYQIPGAKDSCSNQY